MTAPMMTLEEAARIMGAQLRGTSDGEILGVSIDSRTLAPGELFFALPGERVDGHGFVEGARQAGAVAAVVSRMVDARLPQLLVGHTVQALTDLARHWRSRFSPRVVGVTGSSGKTTVKEMIASVLRQTGAVLATRGNRNNHLGVPLTLLQLRAEHQYAVVEMGMNHAGEIDRLSALARPEVSVITNAGQAHLEGLGSVAAVARAKGEIIANTTDTLVLNADDPHFNYWKGLVRDHQRMISFGLEAAAHVSADFECGVGGSLVRFRYGSQTGVAELSVPGRHNVLNALAAVAVAVRFSVSGETIGRGLAMLKPAGGRMAQLPGKLGGKVIDDTYNANPLSVRAAVAVLRGYPGKRILVLGDLAELGAQAPTIHAELGGQIAAAGIDRLFTLGPLSRRASEAFGAGGRHFDSLDSLVPEVEAALADGATVLVKGSRSAAMERVVLAVAVPPDGVSGEVG